MSDSEAGSRKAAGEARRDVIGRVGHAGTDSRYDAVLRYLRSLYVKAPKEPHVPERPKTEPTKEAESEPTTEAE